MIEPKIEDVGLSASDLADLAVYDKQRQRIRNRLQVFQWIISFIATWVIAQYFVTRFEEFPSRKDLATILPCTLFGGWFFGLILEGLVAMVNDLARGLMKKVSGGRVGKLRAIQRIRKFEDFRIKYGQYKLLLGSYNEYLKRLEIEKETVEIESEIALLRNLQRYFPGRKHNSWPRQEIEKHLNHTESLIRRAEKIKNVALASELRLLESFYLDVRKYSRYKYNWQFPSSYTVMTSIKEAELQPTTLGEKKSPNQQDRDLGEEPNTLEPAEQSKALQDAVEREGMRIELSKLRRAREFFAEAKDIPNDPNQINECRNLIQAMIFRVSHFEMPEIAKELLDLNVFFNRLSEFSATCGNPAEITQGEKNVGVNITGDPSNPKSLSGVGFGKNGENEPLETTKETTHNKSQKREGPIESNSNKTVKPPKGELDVDNPSIESKDRNGQSPGDLGLQGELFCLKQETERLRNAKITDTNFPIHAPAIFGDSYGCDIVSLASDLSYKYIEVKTTNGAFGTKFFMSANEMRFMRENASRYEIHRVFNFDPEKGTGQVRIISGLELIEEMYEIQPSSFLMIPTP